MKTSKSSKAFVAIPTDRRTKYLQNRYSFMRGNCTKKIGAKSQLGAEKITFPPKRGWHTDRWTDICFYRVALLLKNYCHSYKTKQIPIFLSLEKLLKDGELNWPDPEVSFLKKYSGMAIRQIIFVFDILCIANLDSVFVES